MASLHKNQVVGKIRHAVWGILNEEERKNGDMYLDEILGKNFPGQLHTSDLESILIQLKTAANATIQPTT